MKTKKTFKKNKKFLVTGGAGFIGSYLSESLLKDGNSVTIIDNFKTGKNIVKGALIVRGDVRNSELVKKLVKENDEVYHLAAAVGVKYCYENPDYAYETNIFGTNNVFKACSFYKKKMLFVSSSAIYGKIESSEVKEEDDAKYGSPSKQEWLYSYTKGLEEGILGWYGRKGHEIKIVRLFNCIGTGQVGEYGMVVPRFVNWAKNNQPIVVYGTGKQTRTFGDVRDIVRGMKIVMDRGENGKAYNLGGKKEISINNLAELITDLTKSKSKITHIPYGKIFYNGFEETLRRKPNLKRAFEIGYFPKFTLLDTLKWIIKK